MMINFPVKILAVFLLFLQLSAAQDSCVEVAIKCEIVGETFNFPCEKLYSLAKDADGCRRVKLLLITTMTNIFSETISATYEINGSKGQPEISVAPNQAISATNTVIFDECEDANRILLDIFVSSFWLSGKVQKQCEDVQDKFVFPKIGLTTISPTAAPTAAPMRQPTLISQPSNQPTTKRPTRNTAQPSMDPWKAVGNIINSNSTKDGCGYAVDISSNGNLALLGCPSTTVNNIVDAGSVELFQYTGDDNGNEWKSIPLSIVGDIVKDYVGISVSFASNANIFAVGEYYGGSGRVRVFAVKDSSLVEQMGSNIDDLNFSSTTLDLPIDLSDDGRRLAVGSATKGGAVKIYDFNGNKWTPTKIYKGESDTIYGTSVSLSGNGKKVAITLLIQNGAGVVKQGRVDLYDIDSDIVPVLIPDFEANSFEDAPSTSISSDGNVFAVGSPAVNIFSGKVEMFNITNIPLEKPTGIGNSILGDIGERCGKSVDLSSDGTSVVIGCELKIFIANYKNKNWEIEKTIDLSKPISSGRLLSSGVSGHPVAMSNSGNTIIVGSRTATGSGAQVFGSPAISPLITPAPVSTPSTNGGTGKGKGNSKGSKGKGKSRAPNASKGKGKSKAPNVTKGKGSKGKGSKKCKKSKKSKKSKTMSQNYAACMGREQCNVSPQAKELEIAFDILATNNSNVDQFHLNQMLCNNSTVRKMRGRFLNSLEIESVYVTDVAIVTEDCEGKCAYNVIGTVFYTGDDGVDIVAIFAEVTSFLQSKLTNGIQVILNTLSVFTTENAYGESNKESITPPTIFAMSLAGATIIATAFYFIHRQRNSRNFPSPKKELRIKRDRNFDRTSMLNLNFSPQSKDNRKRGPKSHSHTRNASFPLKLENHDYMLDYDINSSREILLPSSLSSPVTRRSNKKKSRPNRKGEWYLDLENHIEPMNLYEDTVDL